MKKIKTLIKRPLQLDAQVLRELQTTDLVQVIGGAIASYPCNTNNHNAKRLVVTP